MREHDHDLGPRDKALKGHKSSPCMCRQVGLIVALLVGTVGAGTFVGLQIAQEGRTAVIAVTEALPTWSVKPSSDQTALAKQVALQFI